MKKLTCHCGAIEAEVKIPIGGVEKIMRCNCSICKKKGYIIGVLGPDDFKLTKGEDKLTLYQFYTNTAKHYFCSKCGTYIYTDYASAVGRLTVRTKTLDNSESFPPQVHIFTKDKDPWLKLTDDVICFEKMYDPKKTWPEESLKRYGEYLKVINK